MLPLTHRRFPNLLQTVDQSVDGGLGQALFIGIELDQQLPPVAGKVTAHVAARQDQFSSDLQRLSQSFRG